MATREFSRGLSPVKLDALRELAGREGDNWWKDLLKLWAPGGTPAGEHGLRLAVHDGKLDFYRRGACIGHVAFGHRNRRVAAHVKVSAAYVQGRGATGCLRFGDGHHAYAPGDVRRWIAGSAYKHGAEKWGVDDVVGCNPGVMDLEMGLPGAGPGGSALRVDIVTLDEARGGFRIALWEAKPLHAAALRRKDKDPAIVGQVCAYRKFLTPARADHIIAAYRASLATMLEIAAMANRDLPLVARARDAELTLAPTIGLALFKGVKADADGRRTLIRYSAETWAEHRARLNGIHICEAEDPATLVLAMPA